MIKRAIAAVMFFSMLFLPHLASESYVKVPTAISLRDEKRRSGWVRSSKGTLIRIGGMRPEPSWWMRAMGKLSFWLWKVKLKRASMELHRCRFWIDKKIRKGREA